MVTSIFGRCVHICVYACTVSDSISSATLRLFALQTRLACSTSLFRFRCTILYMCRGPQQHIQTME